VERVGSGKVMSLCSWPSVVSQGKILHVPISICAYRYIRIYTYPRICIKLAASGLVSVLGETVLISLCPRRKT
jgi:hypothetical protein